MYYLYNCLSVFRYSFNSLEMYYKFCYGHFARAPLLDIVTPFRYATERSPGIHAESPGVIMLY